MLKKLLITILILCTISLAACSIYNPNGTQNIDSGENTSQPDITEEIPENKSEPEEKINQKEEDSIPEYNNVAMLQNFWENEVMYNESITFMQNKYGYIYATTLFTPQKIYKITDNAMEKEYVEGVDFHWRKGSSIIEWVEGSSMEYFYYDALNGKISEESEEYLPNSGKTENDDLGRRMLCGVVHCTSEWVYGKQYLITYKYDTDDVESKGIEYTKCQKDDLPNTTAKLTSGEDLNVLFYGDSIFYGCDASGLDGRAPYQPIMSDLVLEGLKYATTGTVNMVNSSMGGWGSYSGADFLTEGTVKSLACSESGFDLAIVSFGMNDVETLDDAYTDNIKTIVNSLKNVNPNCEIVLVSCFSPNPKSTYYGNQYLHFSCHKSIIDDFSNIALVDMFSVHNSILCYKPYISTSGNNINHPNDWMIRIYAENILSAIIER